MYNATLPKDTIKAVNHSESHVIFEKFVHTLISYGKIKVDVTPYLLFKDILTQYPEECKKLKESMGFGCDYDFHYDLSTYLYDTDSEEYREIRTNLIPPKPPVGIYEHPHGGYTVRIKVNCTKTATGLQKAPKAKFITNTRWTLQDALDAQQEIHDAIDNGEQVFGSDGHFIWDKFSHLLIK